MGIPSEERAIGQFGVGDKEPVFEGDRFVRPVTAGGGSPPPAVAKPKPVNREPHRHHGSGDDRPVMAGCDL